MENLKKFFSQFRDQVLKFWNSQSGARKGMIGAVVALMAFGIVTLFALKERQPLEYLFVDVSPDDQQAIVEYLRKANFTEFEIDSKGIKVPANNLLKLRLELLESGLPAHGQVGWEKFDSQDFTRTEFEQKINKMRAIQGELARTIMAVDGVTSARVHIVSPEKSLFVEDQKETTAAIYIKTRRGTSLDPRQIKAIVHMTSRSVEALKPENITIIDADGNLLTKIENQDATAKLTKENLEYKRNIEKELETKVRQIVGRVVGPDRVEAKVDATVDFTQEEQTISDVDPDKSAVVSRITNNQVFNANGMGPTGIPGSKSNVPGEQEDISPNTAGSNNKRDTETVNFDVKKTLAKRMMPMGNIQRLSIAVLVDGKQEYTPDGTKSTFEARSDEEMKKIGEIVKSAIGFKDGRDEVIVHNMLFQLDPYQKIAMVEQKTETRQYFTTLATSGAIALALMMFFAFVVRPYFRWLAYDPAKKEQEKIIEEFKPELESSGIQHVQVKEDIPFDKLTPQEQVFYLAKNDPKRTTEAIRMLLNPQQNMSH